MHRMDISRSTIDREMADEEQLVLNVLWLLYLFIYLLVFSIGATCIRV